MPKKIRDINEILHVNYNNKLRSHRELVKSQISLFNKLLEKRLGNYRPNLNLSLMSSAYNAGLSAFYYTSSYCPFLFRKNSDELIKMQLKKLLHLYLWCTKNKNESTYYKTIILLAQTIYPFLPHAGFLLHWMKDEKELEHVNKKFKDIFIFERSENPDSVPNYILLENLQNSLMEYCRVLFINGVFGRFVKEFSAPPTQTTKQHQT